MAAGRPGVAPRGVGVPEASRPGHGPRHSAALVHPLPLERLRAESQSQPRLCLHPCLSLKSSAESSAEMDGRRPLFRRFREAPRSQLPSSFERSERLSESRTSAEPRLWRTSLQRRSALRRSRPCLEELGALQLQLLLRSDASQARVQLETYLKCGRARRGRRRSPPQSPCTAKGAVAPSPRQAPHFHAQAGCAGDEGSGHILSTGETCNSCAATCAAALQRERLPAPVETGGDTEDLSTEMTR